MNINKWKLAARRLRARKTIRIYGYYYNYYCYYHNNDYNPRPPCPAFSSLSSYGRATYLHAVAVSVGKVLSQTQTQEAEARELNSQRATVTFALNSSWMKDKRQFFLINPLSNGNLTWSSFLDKKVFSTCLTHDISDENNVCP